MGDDSFTLPRMEGCRVTIESRDDHSAQGPVSAYYADKIASLKEIFGSDDIALESAVLRVGRMRFPILDDVIILSDPAQWTAHVRSALGSDVPAGSVEGHAEDIQFTFGAEWQQYDRILPEHEDEFRRYFDIVDLTSLRGARVCDLGCGIGRWSHFLAEGVREIVLVDFSDAIFVARRNLSGQRNALFFMADLTKVPFADDACDFLFCLGVLHHLPSPCLKEARALRRLAPRLLIFLYYALDNRPFYFRWMLSAVTLLRLLVSKVRSPAFRQAFSLAGAIFIYKPLVWLGKLLALAGLGSRVPLYEFYDGKSLKRIEQDVYDRFFTRIEQRVTRAEIEALSADFSEVIVSDQLPYWHFLLRR